MVMDRESRDLIHVLNRRCRDEWTRAEALRAELEHIKGSRLWPLFSWLRRARQWFGKQRDRSAKNKSPQEWLDDACVPPTGRVSIIIPFRDQRGLLGNCLKSIMTSTWRRFEFVLVDNGSESPAMRRFLRRLENRKRFRVVRRPEPFNFARLCNSAAKVARGDYLLFLNNDTQVLTTSWLERMLEVAGDPRIGVVGATLLYPDNTLQHAGVFPTPHGAWAHRYEGAAADATGDHDELRHVRAVPAVTGACLLIGRRLFDELGGFDECFATDGNDVDLCCRVRAQGWRVAVTPHARLIHFGSLSRGYSSGGMNAPARWQRTACAIVPKSCS